MRLFGSLMNLSNDPESAEFHALRRACKFFAQPAPLQIPSFELFENLTEVTSEQVLSSDFFEAVPHEFGPKCRADVVV